MPSGVSLRCVSAGVTLDLPLWPDEIARTLGARQVQELERSGRRALGVPGGMSGDEFSLGFTVRDETGADVSVQPWVNDLEALALTKFPVQLVLGERVAGWFRLDPPTVTETRRIRRVVARERCEVPLSDLRVAARRRQGHVEDG